MNTVRASITGACFALIGASCGTTDDTGDSMSTVGAGTSAPSTTGSTGIEGGAQPTNGTMTPQPSADPDTSPTGAGATGSGSPLPVPTDAASPGSGVPTDGRPPEEPGMSEGPGATGPAEPDPSGTTMVPSEPTGPEGTDDPPVADPPEPEPEPTLVTSGQNAYWQIGDVIEGGGNAEVRVDEGSTHQEWLGFGGTFNEAGWDVLSLLDAAERDRAIRLLFGASDGANFAWGRIPMGSSDFALDRYSLNDTDGDYAMESFSIDRDRELLIPYVKAALAVKPDVRLWASPWSPPAWMKQNGSMDGVVQGCENCGANCAQNCGREPRLDNDPTVLEAYALYFARFVEEYAAEGLTIEHVQPQNEPGYSTRYPSCLWTPELLRDFVGDYLGPTFEARSIGAEIWLGTMSAPEDTQHLTTVMSSSTAAGYIKGFGLQWNTMDSTGSLSSNYRLPVMQTEHRCGNYPWVEPFDETAPPPNDYAYAEESWELIRDWVNAGVHSYSAWNMVLDTYGRNLDWQRPWPQNSLLVVDRQSRTLTATPAYYVFRHVSQYVDPGAVVVGTSGMLDALAFKNPDGSIVTIVYNSGGQARQTTLGVSGTTLQFEVPARGFATVNWQPGQ